jgi:tight adherence protein B
VTALASFGALALAAAGALASFGALALAAAAIGSIDRAGVRSTLVDDDRAQRPGRLGPVVRTVVLALASGAAGLAVAGLGGAIAGALAWVAVPRLRERRRRAAETAALEDGLADAVSAIAAAIRAGRSMSGALEEAASTVGPPLGPRIGALVDRQALGVPVEPAVADLVRSVPGPDGRLVAAVLGLHHRSGGDAPAVLDRVARTLRERRASAREVRSLTAQARLSGAILGFLPIGFFLFLSITARADVERALASTTGATSVAIGLTMQGLAFLWIRRLLRVER